jgi:Ras family protein T1
MSSSTSFFSSSSSNKSTVGNSNVINIVVVGDPGVGKTSLITTLVSGIFPETVPSVLQQVRISPEDTADELGVLIMDTSSDDAERDIIFEKIIKVAHVVVVVYDVTTQETFDRLPKYWLDRLDKVFTGPIVIVGNKIDLLPPPTSNTSATESGGGGDMNMTTTERLKQKVRPLMEKYRIDACLDCSAKTNVHVTDLFYYAQHSVLFPVHPLLDMTNNSLLPKFQRSLTRIFRFYDEDHDNLLSNSELNTFQEQCFGARLPNDDLEGIRAVLQKESSQFVKTHGITLEGFQFLFQLFIQRNRPETAWSVLRKFSYDDSLEMNSSFQTLLKSLHRDQSVELTKRGLAFFASIFHQFDKDNDGALSAQELDDIFAVCGEKGFRPWAPPSSSSSSDKRPYDRSFCNLSDFPDGCLTSVERTVTLSGWLAQWAMTTCLSPSLVVEQLEFLGFPDLTVSTALKFTRKRALEDQDNRLQRTVIRAFCFGSKTVGKSSLLNALVKKLPSQQANSNEAAKNGRSVAGTVRPLDANHQNPSSSSANSSANQNTAGQASWFLVLTEVPCDEQKDFFAKTSSARLDCDLAVMIFDPSDQSSIEYLRRLQTTVPSTVPCVYLANKRIGTGSTSAQTDTDGLAQVQQVNEDVMKSANELCKSYSLALPDILSLEPPMSEQAAHKWSQGMDRVFGLLMTTALFPGAARPISDEQRVIERQNRMLRSIKRVSLVLGVLGGLSYLAYWAMVRNNPKKSTSEREPVVPSTHAVRPH